MKKSAIAVCTVALLSGCTQQLTTNQIIQQVSQPGAQDVRTAILLIKNGLVEDPTSTKLRFLLALRYMELGDYRSADKEWNKLFSDNYQLNIVIPGLMQAKYLMAEYSGLISFVNDLASEHVQQITEGQLATAYIYQALSYYKLNDTQGAMSSVQLANDIATETVFSNLGAAVNAATQAANEDALALINEVLTIQPNFTEAQLLKGQLLTLLLRFSEAQDVFAQIHSTLPNNNRFKLFYAAGMIKNENYNLAKPLLDELVIDLPLNGYVQQLIAVIAYHNQDYAAAKLHAEKAIEGQLYSVSSYSLAALSSIKTGDFEKAKRYLDAINITFPDDHPITNARLLTNAKLGYSDDSVAALLSKDFSKIDPQLITSMAYKLSADGRSKEASKLLQRLDSAGVELSEDMKAKSALLNIALNTNNAIAQLEKAVENGENVADNRHLLLLGYYKNKQYAEALTLANAVIADGQAVIGLTFTALIKLSTNEFSEGKDAFAQVLAIDPQNITALQFFSDFHITATNYDEAIGYIQKVLTIDPYNLNSLNHLYNASLGLNTTRSYLAQIESAYKVFPSRIEYRLLLASARYAVQDFDGVMTLLGRYVTKPSTPPLFWSLLASAKIAKNDFMGAQREYEKWRNTHPKSVEPYIAELGILELNRDWISSERLVNRAINQHPQIPMFKIIKANILIELKKYNEAKNAILILNEEQEKHPKAQTALAHIAFYTQDYEEAVDRYKVLYETYPSDPIVHKYSQSLYHLGRIDDAISLLTKHTNTHKNDLTAAGMLGSFLIKHDTPKAVRVLLNLNSRVPKNVFILNNLAYSYYLLAQNADAENYAKQALDVDPSNEKVLDTLGMIKYKQDDVTSALAFLEIAYSTAPFDVPIVLNYAEVLIAAGNQKEAKKILDSISSNEPELISRLTQLQNKISG